MSSLLPNIHNKLKQRNEEQCCERLKQCVFEGGEEMTEAKYIEIKNKETVNKNRYTCVGEKPFPSEIAHSGLQTRFVLSFGNNGAEQNRPEISDGCCGSGMQSAGACKKILREPGEKSEDQCDPHGCFKRNQQNKIEINKWIDISEKIRVVEYCHLKQNDNQKAEDIGKNQLIVHSYPPSAFRVLQALL